MSDTLGKRIRNFRKKRNLSQDELADLIGKTRSNVSSYETDRSAPPSDVLAKLAEIFGTSTDYLLGKTQSSLPADAKDRFVDSLDLGNDDMLEKFDLILDGKVLDKEQFKMAVAFLRTLQQQARK
ncbi:helix-turn-helix domain-containing protein [Paenibacillus thailandensis]|uniref:Helix-turn-helix domain-containing protein n=1 Tax=Paenibacillus thailandensis TaxID=393250 RepID=A0ABW5R2Q8_9BACL